MEALGFILVTEHKPLLTIIGTKKGLSTLAAARLQKMAITLTAYQYADLPKHTQGYPLQGQAIHSLKASNNDSASKRPTMMHIVNTKTLILDNLSW